MFSSPRWWRETSHSLEAERQKDIVLTPTKNQTVENWLFVKVNGGQYRCGEIQIKMSLCCWRRSRPQRTPAWGGASCTDFCPSHQTPGTMDKLALKTGESGDPVIFHLMDCPVKLVQTVSWPQTTRKDWHHRHRLGSGIRRLWEEWSLGSTLIIDRLKILSLVFLFGKKRGGDR